MKCLYTHKILLIHPRVHKNAILNSFVQQYFSETIEFNPEISHSIAVLDLIR